MPRERKDFDELVATDYQIDGNVFRAWTDNSGRLVFVVDETIDEYKPYVLLVMGSYGERKWDDVLSNDFHVNLENIRPKKENKYQKLDIEYDGLGYYSDLIDVYVAGRDTTAALVKLYDFRDAAVRRAATERLVVATDTVEQAARTAMQTERSITVLQNRRKVLEKRLEHRRNAIGREPAKESAAKILKTESQIEKTDEKLRRSTRRLENALRRGNAAREDAETARDVLSRRRPPLVVQEKISVESDAEKVKNLDDVPEDIKQEPISQTPKITEIQQEVKTETVKETTQETTEEFNDTTEEITLPVPDYETTPEREEYDMPNTQDQEEVKPLLDQDPEILDEEIAFKPVAFDDIKPAEQNKTVVKKEETVNIEKNYDADDFNRDAARVENNNEPIAKPLSFSENKTVSQTYEETTHEEYEEAKPVLNTIQSVERPTGADVDTTGQLSNTQYATAADSSARPASPNVAATASRPISPITGANTKVKPVGEGRSRPTIIYYLLLIILIILSVFTLWLYQKKNGGTVPFLGQNGEEAVTHPDVISGGDVFINPEPEPVVTPTPEPEPAPEPDIPVVVEPDTPINVEYPNNDVLMAAEPTVVPVEPEESVLARKDPYPVSREDQPVYVEERVTSVAAPDVIFDEDVISVPVVPPEYVDEEEMYYNQNGQDATYYQEVQSQEYYPQPEPEYYQQPQQVEYDENVDDGYVQENVDGGFVIESSGNDPESRKYLTVHDGGQYSVGYTETTY